jgi:hypothetical protein
LRNAIDLLAQRCGDGGFIQSCAASKTDRLVVGAVVGIAGGLGKKTIAEYVSDDETVRLLTCLDVDSGPGLPPRPPRADQSPPCPRKSRTATAHRGVAAVTHARDRAVCHGK